MSAPGRPVRVSAEAIARDTGEHYKVLSHDYRLPLTNRALIEVAESEEAWAIRRIRWAEECYHREGERPTRSKLLQRASVDRKFVAKQGLMAIVDEAICSLRLFSQKTG